MDPHWDRYWKQMRWHARYAPIGILISIIPFILNYNYWRERDELTTGLIVSLCFGITIPITITIFFAAVYAVLTFIAARTGKFYHAPMLFYVVVGTLGTMAGIWLSLIVRSFLLGGPIEGGAFLPSIIFGGITVIMFALFFVYTQARQEMLSLKAAVAESRYNALEHQMRPHFLFNALNSLAELIESGREGAADMAYMLSDLYRQILANSRLKTAPVAGEVEIARQYLELEKIRFGARLSYSINIIDEANKAYVPSLMIQTLVENAVKHGISKSLEGGHICIEICRASGLYHLSVTNTGADYSDSGNTGTGLTNTRARLDLIYGDRHRFHIGQDESGKTVASFCFSGEKID